MGFGRAYLEVGSADQEMQSAVEVQEAHGADHGRGGGPGPGAGTGGGPRRLPPARLRWLVRAVQHPQLEDGELGVGYGVRYLVLRRFFHVAVQRQVG